MGLPHAIMITTANTRNRDGAIKMSNLENLSNIKNFLVDGGCDYVSKLLSNGFESTSVRLALVERIMKRHKSKIEAMGKIDIDTEILLYFHK